MSSTEPNVSFEITFRDARTPQQLRVHFEEKLMVLFEPGRDGAGKLVFWATRMDGQAKGEIALRFECAEAGGTHHYYRFRVLASWPDTAAPDLAEYYRKSARGWWDYWVSPFVPYALPAGEDDCDAGRYRMLTGEAEAAEADLTDAASIQRAVLAAMRDRGAFFTTAHKEGGSSIDWNEGRFEAIEQGYQESYQSFADDASFLRFLREFFHWDVTRSTAMKPVPEWVAWKLIYRKLQYPRAR